MRAVDYAFAWIVGMWLLFAAFNDGYAPYICLGGAMLTAIIWAALSRKETKR